MTPTRKTSKPAKDATSKPTRAKGFTDEEREAMREYAKERKLQQSRGANANRSDGEADVKAKIAEMPPVDRVMAERLHTILQSCAPELSPRTWYGMPAYAKNGNVVCFFQSSQKFKTRYSTLGFSDKAMLDCGSMWPVAFALKELTDQEARAISELVKKAVQ